METTSRREDMAEELKGGQRGWGAAIEEGGDGATLGLGATVGFGVLWSL